MSALPLSPIPDDYLLDYLLESRDDYGRTLSAAMSRVPRWPDLSRPEWTCDAWQAALCEARTDEENATVRRHHHLRRAVERRAGFR